MVRYEKGTKNFINPYNFVAINKDAPKRGLKTETGTHTGKLHCKLTTETPLVIPDTQNVSEENGHKTYGTYKIGNQVVIPGSSIRGMLRSVYEAATNSCMVTMDKDERFTKRSDLGTFKPGILKKENGEWVLYKAKRIPLVVDNEKYAYIEGGYKKYHVSNENGEKYIEIDEKKLYFGEAVKIEKKGAGHEKYIRKIDKKIEVWNGCSVSSLSMEEDKTGAKYYLYLGEFIENKHAESVFERQEKLDVVADKIKEALIGLETTLEMYRKESINRNLNESHYGYKGYERAKEKGIIPLWYQEDNSGGVYLSLAAIGRIAYRKKWLMCRMGILHVKIESIYVRLVQFLEWLEQKEKAVLLE